MIGTLALPGHANIRLALAAACVTVIFTSMVTVVSRALNASGNFGLTSAGLILQAAVTVVATAVLLVALGFGVVGAVLAILLGAIAQAGLLFARSMRMGLSLRPTYDPAFLREAVPYGLRVLGSDALGVLAGRLDLLLVYLIASHAAAGQYSIALTIAGLVGLAPFALAYVTFQRIAVQSDADALELVARSCRSALVLATLTAIALAAIAVPLIPLVFGRAYSPAMVPALLLLVGSLPWSVQWILSRAAAAHANPTLTARSSGVTVIVMVGMDAALVPLIGIDGAGVGWCVAASAGLLVCTVHYGRIGGARRLKTFVPTARDISETAIGIRGLLGAVLRSRRPGRGNVD